MESKNRTEPLPVLSIDWLQLNVHTPPELLGEFHPKFKVKRLNFSTRHFKILEEIYIDSNRICTIQRLPSSEIINKDTMLIKFDNWLLYSVDLFTYVSDFLKINNLKFKSISRLDICCDFQEFQNKMKPKNFIKNYVSGDYLRMGKTPNACTHFKQIANVVQYHGLKFGSNLSDVSTYLYNKTLEMNCIKWKPWIAEKWLKSGLNSSLDTWRLEVSLKSSNKFLCNKDTSELHHINNLDILKHAQTQLLYNVLREKYFSFVINSGSSKKNRMTKLPLFKGTHENYTIIAGDKMLAASRSDKIFIKKLEETNQAMRGKDVFFDKNIKAIKNKFIAVTGLQAWASHRGLLD